MPEYPPSSWKALYPFEPHFFRTDEGHRIHYVDEGDGHPVVMLHGNPTWSFMYRNLIPKVAESARRAIAPDLLGFGLSDKPQDWSYRLEGHIRNLEQLLDKELQLPKMSLVLHDWGGAVGMGYAVRHPEKINSIILMNTAAYRSTDIPWRIYLVLCPLLGELLVLGGNALVRGALRMATVRPLSEPVRQGYLAPYSNWHDRIATLKFPRDIPLRPSHPSWQTLADIEARLPLLADKAISLLWGGADFCLHTGFLKRWQAIYPHAAVKLYPDAAHYLLEDSPHLVIPDILAHLR